MGSRGREASYGTIHSVSSGSVLVWAIPGCAGRANAIKSARISIGEARMLASIKRVRPGGISNGTSTAIHTDKVGCLNKSRESLCQLRV